MRTAISGTIGRFMSGRSRPRSPNGLRKGFMLGRLGGSIAAFSNFPWLQQMEVSCGQCGVRCEPYRFCELFGQQLNVHLNLPACGSAPKSQRITGLP